jgi:uncharacterized protein (DUF433 family)
MRSEHLTLRIDAGALARLGRASRENGESRSEFARALIEEGLRMSEHPGIVFRPGPAGRRPAVADGIDVWEIVRVLRELAPKEGETALAHTAELTGMTPAQVRVAARYYADYQDEIDQWIARVDDEAARAEAAWQREQALLGR